MVERMLMVQWVIGSMPHGGPIVLFLVPTSTSQLNKNKGRGTCHPVCGIVYIKNPLLLTRKSNPCSGSSGFPLSLNEWSI